MNALKFADEGIVEGWAVRFGSPARRDAQGEWFSARTDLGLDMISGPRPLLLHHGLGAAGPAIIGRVPEAELRPEGLWVKAVLDRAGRFFGEVKAMLARGALAFSSGTLAHLIRMGPDGEILAWPFVELSLTPTPADPEARIVAVKYAVKAADLRLHLAALRGFTTADRDQLRLIKAHLDGQEPHRGLATAGMGSGLVIQREPPVVHG